MVGRRHDRRGLDHLDVGRDRFLWRCRDRGGRGRLAALRQIEHLPDLEARRLEVVAGDERLHADAGLRRDAARRIAGLHLVGLLARRMAHGANLVEARPGRGRGRRVIHLLRLQGLGRRVSGGRRPIIGLRSRRNARLGVGPILIAVRRRQARAGIRPALIRALSARARRSIPAGGAGARRWRSDRRAAQARRNAPSRKSESRNGRRRSCIRPAPSMTTMKRPPKRNGQSLATTRALAYPRTPRNALQTESPS